MHEQPTSGRPTRRYRCFMYDTRRTLAREVEPSLSSTLYAIYHWQYLRSLACICS